MSLLQNNRKTAEHGSSRPHMRIVIPLVTLALYFGVVGFIGASTVHDHAGSDTSGGPQLFP